ncbi:MAG: hypothetical protein ABI693_10340 [Bryobacteraceae bacterium]
MKLVLALTVAAWAWAQEAPPPKLVLTNTGKPLAVAIECGAREIEALSLTCTIDEPCAVYLELAAADAAGDRLFVSGNLHTDKTTLYSILLASEDGGKTWSEAVERIAGASLDQLQFIDLEVGWVAGQMAGALPRDPFFLLTTNSGKAWSRRPVFAETRVGTIDQFWFETRTSGSMTVDRTQTGDSGGRHELYESMTGGESWSLSQVSTKPVPLKKARPAGPGTWRIRADGRTKSFRVERRGSTEWATVASFLIAAGQCKPAEQQLKEPEPVPTAAADPEASGVFQIPGAPDAPKKKPRKPK